jgi:proline iminopeptidase
MKFQLFPSIDPFQKGFLDLSNYHQMYWQVSGNPSGEPVVWLHGGPGSSASPLHRRLFDPEKFYIVQYDQRGCGLSTPRGSIHDNTTGDLIKDVERLRQHLGVAKWHVVGGSWGGSLGLIYAQSHAHVMNKVLLRSTFLCTDSEIERYTQLPPTECRERWEKINSLLKSDQSETVLDYSYRIFCLENDVLAQTQLAHAWVAYEGAMNDYPTPAPVLSAFDNQALIARYRVQMHYLKNRCFVQQPIFVRPEVLSTLDLTLVHGDQDALCPYENSLKIQNHAPQAKFFCVSGVGHNMFDEQMIGTMLEQIAGWV